nr:phosphoadenosine phosphosulfate reductase family protein [Candidatus Microthrix sp.]
MLYSVGKDSATMLHLARKAFHPSVRRFRCCTSTPPGSSRKCTS